MLRGGAERGRGGSLLLGSMLRKSPGMSGASISTEELWNLISTRLRSFLVHRVGDEQVAEDLLQETFLRIHGGLDTLDDTRRISAWVFRIAGNLVVDHRRAAAGLEPLEAFEDDAAVLDDESGNLNEVVRDWIPAMIARLPDTYRRAVELYELEGLPQQRIADELGLSLSGAKSRVQRGREKLKAMLLDCCTFERDRRGNVIDYVRNEPGPCGPCEDATGTRHGCS